MGRTDTTDPIISCSFNQTHVSLNTPWFTKINASLQAIIFLIRYRYQHIATKHHLHKIKLSSSPYCDGDNNGTVEDVNHICFFSAKYRNNTELHY